jgi:Protein of unknown function (DUF732)
MIGWRIATVKSPLVAALTSAAVLLAAAPQGHADPGYYSSAEDNAFIAAITGDGITMNRADAITEGHAVCMFLLSGSGSMMDAMIQAKQQHSWNMTEAAHFVDRSVQNYCPSRAPF